MIRRYKPRAIRRNAFEGDSVLEVFDDETCDCLDGMEMVKYDDHAKALAEATSRIAELEKVCEQATLSFCKLSSDGLYVTRVGFDRYSEDVPHLAKYLTDKAKAGEVSGS